MTIEAKPFFRWYDLWIGAYWDRESRVLYVCPAPMVGVRLRFGTFWRVVDRDPPTLSQPFDEDDEG